MSELPTGWTIKNLPEIVDIKMGQSPPGSTYNRNGKGLPFFQGKAEFGSLYPTTVKYCDSPKTIAQAEDVLISVRAPVGATNLAKETCSFGRGLACLRPKDGVPSLFLLYFLRSIENWLSAQGTGSTFTAISKSNLDELEIPVPPLNEQKRIVEKLEKLLGRVEAVQARLDKIPTILKRFRQSVLAAAYTGKITTDWRNENANPTPVPTILSQVAEERARLLFAGAKKPTKKQLEPIDISELYSRESLEDLPPHWSWATVDQLSTKVVDGIHHKPDYVSEGIPFLTIRDLTAGRGISFENTRFVSDQDHKVFYGRANPEKGDILITKDGTLGIVRLIETDRVFSIFVSLALVKPVLKSMSRYLAIALTYPQVQERIVRTGTGLQHIHLRDLRAVPIPVPPLEEQTEIVRRVEELFRFADAIEERYKKAKAHTDKLTQSILAKAFRGELVPQDPTDEPAADLLKRVGKATK